MDELTILYEDNHIIVVMKPQGLPSCGDESGDDNMLEQVRRYVKEKYNKPGNVYIGLIHRLDRPTGGVMVFAKTSKAASRLAEQMRSGDFEKKYRDIEATSEGQIIPTPYRSGTRSSLRRPLAKSWTLSHTSL